MSGLPIWRPPRWLRYLVASALLWAAGGVAMVLAIVGDGLRQGQQPSLWRSLGVNLPYFLPLVVFTWGTALALARAGTGRRADTWRIGVLALVLFVPLNAAWSVTVTLWVNRWAWSDWWRQAEEQRFYGTWTDAMIAAGTLAAVIAWNDWRLRRDAEARWQATEADNYRLRLQLLQGQLEPHFLFNALNGVSALVRAGDRAVALTALAEVSDLLRAALRASRRRWTSLADELAFVRGYMQVQALRFGPSLVFDAPAAEESWHALACPPLLLQPLVENAVRHGIEAVDGAGTIRLRVREGDNGRIVVRFESPLAEAGAGSVPGHGLGLAATRERLTLLYGDRARLHAMPEGDHFVAEIDIPREHLPDDLDGTDR